MVALVTNAGLANIIAAWVAYTSRPLYLGYGTGSGQDETANDLVAPVQARTAGSSAVATTDIANDTYRVTGTLTADAAVPITEVGVFDAANGGNMDVYGDFTAINLAIGDAITFQVSVTAS